MHPKVKLPRPGSPFAPGPLLLVEWPPLVCSPEEDTGSQSYTGSGLLLLLLQDLRGQ